MPARHSAACALLQAQQYCHCLRFSVPLPARMPRFLLLLVFSLVFLAVSPARADEGRIERIEPALRQGQLQLDADIDFTLGDDLQDAARKGVPLYFTADLDIEHPRWWWFNETVLSIRQTWRIQYNALTRQWRVGTGDLSLPATTLDEALDLVRHIRDWPLADASRSRSRPR